MRNTSYCRSLVPDLSVIMAHATSGTPQASQTISHFQAHRNPVSSECRQLTPRANLAMGPSILCLYGGSRGRTTSLAWVRSGKCSHELIGLGAAQAEAMGGDYSLPGGQSKGSNGAKVQRQQLKTVLAVNHSATRSVTSYGPHGIQS